MADSNQSCGSVVDPLLLQPDQSLGFSEDRRLCPADSLPGDSLTCEQAASGLPDKVIGQRNCTVERPDVSDNPQYHSGDRRATLDQQESESQTNDDDGSWQVVSRRRSGRQRPPGTASAGKCDGKNGARAKTVSARRLPKNSSAGHRVSGQKQPLCRSDQVAPSSMTSSAYWPVCTSSFVRLASMNWAAFQTLMVNTREHSSASLTEPDFLRFRRLMKAGPRIVRQPEDLFFLAGPFKVLLPSRDLSHDTALLSLLFERTTPGFVELLGDRFVSSLSGLDRKHGRLFTATTELLVQICRADPHWLDRLGWQKLNTRHRCNLFSSSSFLLKENNQIQLIRNLHQQVSGLWLQDCHYAVVQKTSRELTGDMGDWVRDLKASVRALSCWLEVRFFITGEIGERYRLVAIYADMVESVIGVVDRLDPRPSRFLHGIWQAIAHWLFYFRKHLRDYVGFDKTITLLDDVLRHIHRWSDLEKLAFQLRMALLGTALMKCEYLLLKRNRIPFSKAWHQYRSMLPSLLTRCGEFMKSYQPPFAIDDQSMCAQHKENARWDLLLKEFNYHRLDCESRTVDRGFIQEKLQLCREAFDTGWKLSSYHREIGVLELAKWCFMAGEHEAGVTSLVGVCFKLHNLSLKKADLLASHGAYQAALDEFRHSRALITNSDAADTRKLDNVDDRIAMVHLMRYKAGHDTDHLVAAYQLSVALLGRCHIEDRSRFEGGLAHIVNAMKNSGLKFTDYVEQTSVLGFLVKEGCTIGSWGHFADLLYIRHKVGMTEAGTVHKVADKMRGNSRTFFDMGKMA